MKRLMVLWMLTVVFSLASCGNDHIYATEQVVDTIHRLNIIVGDHVLTAKLYDNPTARDFISRLPFTVDLSDYDSSEKIFTPSPGLTTSGSLLGMKPKAGDITLYAPWGNIAIFYKNGTSSGSLIPIGQIENNVNVLNVSGTVRSVRFELINVTP